MKLRTLSTLLSAAVLSATAMTVQAEDVDYILNTASTGGTYHPVGTAIATLSKVKLLPKQKFSLTAVNSAGSGANVQALAANTAQFAILQGFTALMQLRVPDLFLSRKPTCDQSLCFGKTLSNLSLQTTLLKTAPSAT